MHFPDELHYTKDHEWIRMPADSAVAVAGITDFAQRELGDIVFVELEPVGTELEKETVFGTVEAVKTVSELYMPVSGKIAEVNTGLEARPEAVNDDPYGEGWMVKIEMTDPTEIDSLMNAEEYAAMVGA
jgi:glycine cleavage system H protein